MLNIDLKAFKALCESSRAHYAQSGMDAEMIALLHCDGIQMQRSKWGRKAEAEAPASEGEIAADLRQAAMRCVDRASEKQIKYLAALIVRAGKSNQRWDGEPLSKARASRYIEELKG
ncbi:MAG: hypothetical protein Q4G36_08130 [Paracoccus sp. (in: a-proteobacteria)]|nr:hypothetical protein [Paracoccus sp. (in: a-proteobacteria)]